MPETILTSDPSARRTPPDDVHLQQLHRFRPLPTLVIGSCPLAGLRRDQPMADQTAVDRRTARHRLDAVTDKLMADRARTPLRMRDPQLHDARLHLRWHLMRTRRRPRRRIDQPGQTPNGVATQPHVHCLPRHPRNAAPHPSPWRRRRRPPAPRHTAAPPVPAPPARPDSSATATTSVHISATSGAALGMRGPGR